MLKYSWRHKSPERQSALTYWEEDIPPRIDLGRNKYGGPFTVDEVENVKTVLRLILLIFTAGGSSIDLYIGWDKLLNNAQVASGKLRLFQFIQTYLTW